VRRRKTAAGLALLLVAGVPANASANAESVRLRAQASRELYSLDREKAQETFRQATVADPRDAGAYRGLASALWLSVKFRRGNRTVDDYMGGVTAQDAAPPAAGDRRGVQRGPRARAGLARERAAANPGDADAHYEVGAAMGAARLTRRRSRAAR
jgi:hypothetical protein